MNLWTTGHPTEALAFGQSAQAIAESLGDVSLQVMGSHHLGVACLGTGDYPRAEDLFRKALRLLEGDRSRERFGFAGIATVMARVEHADGHYRDAPWQPKRLSLVEFPNFERAKRWYDSEEYRPFKAMRLRAAKTNVVLLEGQ